MIQKESPTDLILSITDLIISPSDLIVLPFDNYQHLKKSPSKITKFPLPLQAVCLKNDSVRLYHFFKWMSLTASMFRSVNVLLVMGPNLRTCSVLWLWPFIQLNNSLLTISLLTIYSSKILPKEESNLRRNLSALLKYINDDTPRLAQYDLEKLLEQESSYRKAT